MIKLSQEKTKRMVAIHGWSGFVLGALLYVVVLTGALAVFAHEIGTWSVGGKQWHDPLKDRWVAVALNNTKDTVPLEYHEDISISTTPDGRLRFFYHTHTPNADGRVEDKGVLIDIDPDSMNVLDRREGFRSEIFDGETSSALERFLVNLHVNLHAPQPWGLYLTGIMGFAMLLAAITGFILHRHLIKEMFLAPRLSSLLVNARDRHNLIGTWGLPFCVILGFTGAFFSFALSLGLPVLAMVSFGGDQQALLEALVEPPHRGQAVPAAMVHLDGVLAQARAAAGSDLTFVSLHNWGKSTAEIFTFHEAPSGAYERVSLVYSGTTGAALDHFTGIGRAPSLGNDIFNLFGALHFGTFAGLLSRVIWLALGMAMAYLTWTGVSLWLGRRAGDPAWQPVVRALPTFGYGLPLALAGAGVFYFLTLDSSVTAMWTGRGFTLTAAAVLAYGWWHRERARIARGLLLALGMALLALPLLRLLTTGLGWFAPEEGGVVFMVDATLAATGLLCLRMSRVHGLDVEPTAPMSEGTPAE